MTEGIALLTLKAWEDYAFEAEQKMAGGTTAERASAKATRKLVQVHVNWGKAQISCGADPTVTLLAAMFKVQTDIMISHVLHHKNVITAISCH